MTAGFSDILSGQKLVFKILENESCLAFLSETPMRRGHTLVIPKGAADAVFEMTDEHLAELMIFAKRAAGMIRAALPCVKVGLMAAGIQVRHAHLHLVPIDQPSDLDFSKQKPAEAEDLKAVQTLILKFAQLKS